MRTLGKRVRCQSLRGFESLSLRHIRYMRGLVWLRSDLRLDDNPSFESTFLECEEAMAVYFYSSKQWKITLSQM